MSTLPPDNKLEVATETNTFDLFVEKMINAAELLISPLHAHDESIEAVVLSEENPLLAYEDKILEDTKNTLCEIEGEVSEGFGHVLHRIQQFKGQPTSSEITLSEQHDLNAKMDTLNNHSKNIDSQRIDLSPMHLDDTALIIKESSVVKMSMSVDAIKAIIAPVIPAPAVMPAAVAAPAPAAADAPKGWFDRWFGRSPAAAPKADDKKPAVDALKMDDKKSTADAPKSAEAPKIDDKKPNIAEIDAHKEAPGIVTRILDSIHPGYLFGIISKEDAKKPAAATAPKADDKKSTDMPIIKTAVKLPDTQEMDADVNDLLSITIVKEAPKADDKPIAEAFDADVNDLLSQTIVKPLSKDPSPLATSVLNIAKGIPSTLKIENPIDSTVEAKDEVDSLLQDIKLSAKLPVTPELDPEVDSLLDELVVPPSLSGQVIAAKDVVNTDDDVEDLLANTRVILQAVHSPAEPGMTYSGVQASGELKSALIDLRLATENYKREVHLKEVAEEKLNSALIRLNTAQKTALEAGDNAQNYRDDTNSNVLSKFQDKYITARVNDFPAELKLGFAQSKKAAIHEHADAQIAKIGKEEFKDAKVKTLPEIKTLIESEIAMTDGMLKLSKDQFAKLEGQYQDSMKGKWFSAVRGGSVPDGYYSTKEQVSMQERKLANLKVKQLEVAELEKKVAAWDNLVDALNNESAAKLHVVTCQQEHGLAVAKVASAEIPMKAAEAVVASLEAPHHEHHADHTGNGMAAYAPIKTTVVDEHAIHAEL